jgi:hypothetical protein
MSKKNLGNIVSWEKTMGRKPEGLHQGPCDPACTCHMKEPCSGCETYGEWLNTRQPDTELVEALRKFALKVIGSHCWGYDSMDGLDIQELAEVLGLLEQHTATTDDVDDESDFEVGDPIYKFSGILKEKTNE